VTRLEIPTKESNIYASIWVLKPFREMKVTGDGNRKVHHRPILRFSDGFEKEHSCWDPKDGELCLDRMKPEETLVEARSGSDMQIDRQIWV